LSGSFDISSFFDGYHDDNIYFNSPYEYLLNMHDPWKYNHMGIILGTGEWDYTRSESYRLSAILNSKGIKHWLEDGKWRGHDWNYWQDMLPYYLSARLHRLSRAKSRTERLGRRRHGREGQRLSEREVSESNPVALPAVALRDSSNTLRSARNDRI
jgi:hypothetical protein